jgi:hypothetical protein
MGLVGQHLHELRAFGEQAPALGIGDEAREGMRAFVAAHRLEELEHLVGVVGVAEHLAQQAEGAARLEAAGGGARAGSNRCQVPWECPRWHDIVSARPSLTASDGLLMLRGLQPPNGRFGSDRLWPAKMPADSRGGR